MKIKYCIGLLLISAIVFFIIGLRMGIKQGTLDTIPIMLDRHRFYIADRVAVVVKELHKMKKNNSQTVNCQLKILVQRQISDWNSCKENQFCLENVSKGFYAETDLKIADFMALSCGE
jgi:hypothetical protein